MRILFNDDGSLDEFIAENASVHFEQMDDCAWWMRVDLPNGDSWHVNVGAVNPRAKGYALAELNL